MKQFFPQWAAWCMYLTNVQRTMYEYAIRGHLFSLKLRIEPAPIIGRNDSQQAKDNETKSTQPLRPQLKGCRYPQMLGN
jgi:hypothetical protein